MNPLCKGRSMTIWGVVTQDAKVRTFDSGKTKTTFSMRYAQEKDEDGNKISKYMEVEAWGKLALYASGIERGDVVHVDGEWMRDDYLSEKKGEDRYKLMADIIFVQPFSDEEPSYSAPPAATPEDAFQESADEDDGELPF